MPFPGTRIISFGWSAHHAKAIPTSMNATVRLGRPTGPPAYDPETGDTTQPHTEAQPTPARVQQLAGHSGQAPAEAVGQRNLRGRGYLVQLPFDVLAPELGDRIRVIAAINDASLVGQHLWVIDPQLGSERFTRDVLASDNQADVEGAP